MKRLLLSVLFLLGTCATFAQGIPFIRSFSSDDYHGHPMNLDVITDDNGVVFVANFEGLLYYDNVRWHILHTPNLARVTVVYRDKQGDVWVGGYNYFGKVVRNPNGSLYLKSYGTSSMFLGEVVEIWEDDEDSGVRFLIKNGTLYTVKHDELSVSRKVGSGASDFNLTDVLDVKKLSKSAHVTALTDTIATETLGNGLMAVVRKGRGLTISDNKGNTFLNLNDTNGLKSNNIEYISYDGHGTLWAVLENEICAIAIPSAFSHVSRLEGLTAEVKTATAFNGRLYAGTLNGTYRLEGKKFIDIGIGHDACWQLLNTQKGLLAATAYGIFRIQSDGSFKQLTQKSSISVLETEEGIYSGELDGVYLINPADNSRRLVSKLDNTTKIIQDRQGVIWLQNVFGEIWCKGKTESGFRPYRKTKQQTSSVLVQLGDSIKAIDSEATSPIPYPLFSWLDNKGVTWLTNNTGTNLYRWKDGHRLQNLSYLYPFKELRITAMYQEGQELWLGHKEGFTVIDMQAKDPAFQTKPRLVIRSVTLGNDSVIWGGFGEMPSELPLLGSHDRNLHFTYSLDYVPVVGRTLYRYQLNDGNWSGWSERQDVSFLNLPYGSYTLRVQGRNGFGHETDITALNFSIDYPFYMKWYVICLYFILFLAFLYLLVRLRLRSLKKDKALLEKVVRERTAEIVKQKDEIQEKSESLEKALDDLHSAQDQLIRQEKMATVGKLTQGLIDRILNPLNYINNFSKLSEGLVKDIEANIEDEKDHLSEDNYEDTIEVLGMLKGNLQKVGEHGQNTTRTLKAMEEMLKDRTGGIIKMDITEIFRQNEEMVRQFFAEQIARLHVSISFSYPSEKVFVKGNPELLSKVFMSLLGNSMYAIDKKGQQTTYQPEITLKATVSEGKITILLRDNGIGIEETIIHKIFDPFFTTKTTGEASGTGLYLSHDIIQNYGGTINVSSVKDEFTEFCIMLPIIIE